MAGQLPPVWFSRPFFELFGWQATPVNLSLSALCAMWAICVWAWCGGAITRLAAVQLSQERRLTLAEAAGFACVKWRSYVGGPIFPLVFVLVLSLLLPAVAGLIARIDVGFVGVALLATSGWLVVTGYPSLTGYRLEVAPEGLTLKVPPDLDELIPWESIEALELEGFSYARIGGNLQFNGAGMLVERTALELPDWKTMKLTLAGGQSHTIQLDELSIEHRQIFAKALIKRAGLVDE